MHATPQSLRLLLLTVAVAAAPARARAEAPPSPRLQVPLGVTLSGWKGGFADAARRIEPLRALGFPLVTLVPAYAYVGLNSVELASGPDPTSWRAAVEAALRAGLQVVVKPHLEPPAFQPGFDSFGSPTTTAGGPSAPGAASSISIR